MTETHTVYWGDINDREAEVRLPPGMGVGPHVEEVSGVSPVHIDDDMLPHPPEWEHLTRHLPDRFNTYQEGCEERLSKNDIVVHVAVGLTESFVHELMEWLAVDGQRVFNPHPLVEGEGDQHWGWIAERLKEFYADLLDEFPDEGWVEQPT